MPLPRIPTVATQEQSRTDFLRLTAMNPTVCQIVDRLASLKLPDAWVAGGCLFQTAWNVLAGEDPNRAIKDYDIFYFNPIDCTRESEEEANHRASVAFADLGCRIDLRNQARVHLWYAQEFGVSEYPRLTKATDGIDNFLAICCMVGVRKVRSGDTELYAPFGVNDVLARVMRPNPWFPLAPRSSYYQKADRWRTLWPDLVVEPFEEAEGVATAGGGAIQ
jgi:hypothetical protein